MNALRLALFIFVMTISSSSCASQKDIECGGYAEILRSDDLRAQLLRWADEEIFSRTFGKKDFEEILGFVGPGRQGADFSIERSGIQIPSFIDGYSIRSVGPDRYHPNVIFVARRRYQGILISRGDFEDSLKGTKIDPSAPEMRKGRLAMICSLD
ncbi:hypothetical protein [Dokdonella ginsengisoli]|uniref:Uncharacterized protein n=1 Tax=Dokdonella ginsengisoli TaxID=363846 RepID=A0ABV9QZX7_9GAMM